MTIEQKIADLEAKAAPLREIDDYRITGSEYSRLCDYCDQLNSLYRSQLGNDLSIRL